MSFRRPYGNVEQMSKCFDRLYFKTMCVTKRCVWFLLSLVGETYIKSYVREHVYKDNLIFEFHQF